MSTYASDMAALVGRKAAYADRSGSAFATAVRILDVKESYGTVRVLIVPISGSGSKWVNLDSVAFAEPTEPRWDRSGCHGEATQLGGPVCTCHDDTLTPYPCSACGCRPAETEEESR